MVPALLSAVGVRLARRSVAVTGFALGLALVWSAPAVAHDPVVTAAPGVGAAVRHEPHESLTRPGSSRDAATAAAVGPHGSPSAKRASRPGFHPAPAAPAAAAAAPRPARPTAPGRPPGAAPDEDAGGGGPWWPKLVAGVMVLLGVVSSIELLRRRSQ